MITLINVFVVDPMNQQELVDTLSEATETSAVKQRDSFQEGGTRSSAAGKSGVLITLRSC
jgi:hypothetical protein